MHEIPEQTMQRTHANSRCPFITLADSWFRYFRAQNQNYLVVIDYYSKYIEALQLKGEASQDVCL